jgi:YD repeat-containing protein
MQERKLSPTGNTYAVSDRTYNTDGLLASQSLPYFSTGSAYNPLKRTKSIANAVGTTNNTYSKSTTTVTDPNGHVKDLTSDAFGNLASVVEHGASNFTTSYTYDSLNDLATTTDSAGNVRGFTYDDLGRRLTAQDLHVSTDTSFGTWSYAYDPQ